MTACRTCGRRELPDESRFCLACGARLSGAGRRTDSGADGYTPPHLDDVLARRSAREGERKEVTVLVADVAGSLDAAQRLDPEDVHAVMDGLFEIALEEVHAEGGTLNQFRGDGFMALFGAPSARADHAVEAVRAAVAIRDRVEAYSRSVRDLYGVPILLRLGVHTGSVWVGSIGDALRRDYTAEGVTVGLAARLEQAADPGQILTSAATARRVAAFFELRALGERRLRGVDGPIEVFAVRGPTSNETALDAERARGLGHFVGRAEEIAHLESWLSGLTASSGRAIEVSGEPGIGKSRLVDHVRARSPGPWLEGRCREGGRSRAYYAWIDLLRRRDPVGRDGSALLDAMSGAASAVEPHQLLDALRAELEAQPGNGPVRILFEDAQWMQVSSLRLIDGLLEHPPARGLGIVLTMRPEGAGGVAGAESLPLHPLPARDSLRLAECELGGNPDARSLAELAGERGRGNPLFVQQVARALREGGDELRRGARLEIALRRSPARVPETLEGVIAARIDALSEPAKRMLQTASVLGRPFSPSLLEALDRELSGRPASVEAELVRAGLLVRTEGKLDFHHALFRDVAYGQMVRARRRALHRSCAVALEAGDEAHRPERRSEIGFHYDQGGEPRRAAEALADAGSAYAAMSAAREAELHLRRAWELLESLPASAERDARRVRAGLDLCKSLNALDRAQDAAAVLEAIDVEDVGPEDRNRVAETCLEAGWIHFSERGEVRRARDLVQRGIAIARSCGSRTVEARGHVYRARVCHLDGRIEEALESCRRVAALATGGGDRLGVVLGVGNEGYVICDTGPAERGLSLARQAYELAEEADHEVGIALASAWLVKSLVYTERLEEALGTAERARAAAERAHQVGALYNAEMWRGAAHLGLGQPKRAREAFERMAEINSTWVSTLDWLAVGALECGDFERAVELARRCLDRHPPRLVRSRALRTLGAALGSLRWPDPAEAEAALGESLTLATELGLRPHGAETFRALAEFHGRAGDEKRAGYYADRALRAWEACGMEARAARARSQIASTA